MARPARVKTDEKLTVSESFMKGNNPIDEIKEYLDREDTWEEALLALRAIGSGSSPWARLLYLKSMRL
jgi:hypothetical protein